MFQSTHPRRVRPFLRSILYPLPLFQSTHPRRVRPLHLFPFKSKSMFQSTHPRRVRPDDEYSRYEGYKFQSTHPRRVRLFLLTSTNSPECFNPRTHVGCDTVCTHTAFGPRGFNPHTHVGCDHSANNPIHMQLLFQSTHPRRVRLMTLCDQIPPKMFQSTHPRRVRPSRCFSALVYILVSIHAPT